MYSKIIFSIALALVVLWIYLFTFFDKFIYIHLVAVLAFIGFAVSYFINNKNENSNQEEE